MQAAVFHGDRRISIVDTARPEVREDIAVADLRANRLAHAAALGAGVHEPQMVC